MREILFRGKEIDTGAWVEGAFCIKDCDDPFGPLVDRPTIIKYEEPHSGYWFRVDPETVGQFTGLTDMNGKKIFEGDILRAKVYEMEFVDFPGIGKRKVRTGNKIDAVWTVEYKNFNASCGYFIYGKDRRFNRLLTYSVIFNNECEVIGNIHNNPELLEVSDGN